MIATKRLRFILILAGAIFVLVLCFRLLTSSKITVTVLKGAGASNTQVAVDGKTVSARGAGGNTYVAGVGFGKHKVTVSSAGYRQQSAELSTGFRSQKSISFELEQETAEAVATGLYKPDSESKISNARFFGTQSWLVFSVGAATGGGDGALVVAKYDSEKSTWGIVSEGTDFDTSEAAYKNAPKELITFLRGL